MEEIVCKMMRIGINFHNKSYRIANSQSKIANEPSGVFRLVLQIEQNRAVYSVAMTINKIVLIPRKTNAEYCHPSGKGSR